MSVAGSAQGMEKTVLRVNVRADWYEAPISFWPIFRCPTRTRQVEEKEDAVLKCRDMAELATPYLEGALSPRMRLAAWLHLRLCDACRRYIDQVRRTIRFLGSGPPPPPPSNEREIMELLDSARRDQ